MRDYYHEPKDMIKHTIKPPKCPKCGSGKVKRVYRKGSQGFSYSTQYGYEWSGKEFLECICQDCHYTFPQKTLKAKATA